MLPVLPICSRVGRRANCQVHPLTIEIRDKARDLSARFRWRIFEPENAEVLKADRGEHRSQIRGEKREGARLLICGTGVPGNDEATEPSAPTFRRSDGELDPKVWKLECASGALCHLKRIDFGHFG